MNRYENPFSLCFIRRRRKSAGKRGKRGRDSHVGGRGSRIRQHRREKNVLEPIREHGSNVDARATAASADQNAIARRRRHWVGILNPFVNDATEGMTFFFL